MTYSSGRAPFSPRSRSPRSRRSRASCPPRTGCRWAASRALSCIGWSSSAASRRRRRRRSGAGCATMRSSRGRRGRGSSCATRSSRPRPAACSICTRASSRPVGCGPTSTSSAPMRSLSCRRSGAATKRSRSGRAAPALVEFEYRRAGTLAYLAAWDVHHANLFDRVEPKTGIQPFGRLVEQVMTIEPYKSASRVFWVVDNGSSHAGKTSIARMQNTWNNARLIHLPIHASWLNQAELYFSILQRKALTPNDFVSLEALAERLLAFGEHYRQIARPFEWTFTRNDLDRVLARIADHEPHLQLAA